MSSFRYHPKDNRDIYSMCTNMIEQTLLCRLTSPEFDRRYNFGEKHSMDSVWWRGIVQDIIKPNCESLDFNTVLFLYVPVGDVEIIKDMCCMAMIATYLDEIEFEFMRDTYSDLTIQEVENVGCQYWVYEEFMMDRPFTFTKEKFRSLLNKLYCDKYVINRLKSRRRESIIEELNCNFNITGLISYLYNISEMYLCQLYNNTSTFNTTFDIIKAILCKDVTNVTTMSECAHNIIIDYYKNKVTEI